MFRPGGWRDGLTSESHVRTSIRESDAVILAGRELTLLTGKGRGVGTSIRGRW